MPPAKSLIVVTMITVLVLILGLVVWCTESNEPEPIPKSHPAYGFYQTAKRGNTTLAVCESHGGKEIYPNDYEILENIDQGVFTLQEKATGKKYLGVSFGEEGLIVTLKTCCWKIDT